MAAMIGVDPHKASHKAVVIDQAEMALGELRVRSGTGQLERLLGWAAKWPERTWAVEGAGGLAYLLAQQLIAAGERVVDVLPKVAARVRLLATGSTSKNDPNDARSVAVAALRSLSMIEAAEQAGELVPGGISGQIYAAGVAKLLDDFAPDGAAATARYELALEFLADWRRIDEQMHDTKRRSLVSGTVWIATSLPGRLTRRSWPLEVRCRDLPSIGVREVHAGDVCDLAQGARHLFEAGTICPDHQNGGSAGRDAFLAERSCESA